MCDFCKKVLVDFKIEHSKVACPLRNSLYCSYCASYGHSTDNCYDKPSIEFREPCFKEQIILPPGKALKDIQNPTRINSKLVDEVPRVIRVKKDNKSIKSFLKKNGVTVHYMKDCRDVLERFAIENSKEIIYIP